MMADLESAKKVVEFTAKELHAAADRLCSDFEKHRQVRSRRLLSAAVEFFLFLIPAADVSLLFACPLATVCADR